MNTTILNLSAQYSKQQTAESVLTFRPFANYLKTLKEKSVGNKTRFFSFIIEKYELHPELLGPVNVEDVKKYSELLEMIYSILSPLIEDEEKRFWAFSLPLQPIIFYSTNAYFNLVSQIKLGNIQKHIHSLSLDEVRNNQLKFSYSMILEKCYNIPSFFKQDTIHSVKDETGLIKY